VTLGSQVCVVNLERLDYKVPLVRSDNQDFEVNEAIKGPLEQRDHQDDLVFRDLLVILASQVILGLPVSQASAELSVCRV